MPTCMCACAWLCACMCGRLCIRQPFPMTQGAVTAQRASLPTGTAYASCKLMHARRHKACSHACCTRRPKKRTWCFALWLSVSSFCLSLLLAALWRFARMRLALRGAQKSGSAQTAPSHQQRCEARGRKARVDARVKGQGFNEAAILASSGHAADGPPGLLGWWELRSND